MVKLPFNKITNVPIDVFENLENLEVLDLSYNHVQKVKMPVKNLGRLTQLNMHVNNFTDFPNRLPRALRVLILEQNKIRSIKRRSLGTDINSLFLIIFDLSAISVYRPFRHIGHFDSSGISTHRPFRFIGHFGISAISIYWPYRSFLVFFDLSAIFQSHRLLCVI